MHKKSSKEMGGNRWNQFLGFRYTKAIRIERKKRKGGTMDNGKEGCVMEKGCVIIN